MLALYYAPGACSMAAHRAGESGEKYGAEKVDLAGGGSAPGLSENQPEGACARAAPRQQRAARREHRNSPISANASGCGRPIRCGGQSAIAHRLFLGGKRTAHAHIGRPERYASDPSGHPRSGELGRENYAI
jgi:hypothetical protein